ncbi:MAG: hypothetical protein LUG88_03835 [Clostridia bacterium]|nr:hypothetical protein [Clostridia bacterium]
MNKKFSARLFSTVAAILTASAIVVSVTVMPLAISSDITDDEIETTDDIIVDEDDKSNEDSSECRPDCNGDERDKKKTEL